MKAGTIPQWTIRIGESHWRRERETEGEFRERLRTFDQCDDVLIQDSMWRTSQNERHKLMHLLLCVR